jgi:hypothetical protein
MKLINDKEVDLQYYFKNHDTTEYWFYGDFLKKASELLKDNEDSIKVQGEIYNVQNTEWPTLQIYQKNLARCADNLKNHIGTHEDPFKL